MNQFTEIRIDGFRRLCGIKLPLKPLNVIIGANGVGKTSLLDVFDVLKAAADGGLAEKVNDLQGFGSILTRDERDSISIGLSALLPSTNCDAADYALALKRSGFGYAIDRESLRLNYANHESPYFNLDSTGDRVKFAWPDGESLALEEPISVAESALSQLELREIDCVTFRSLTRSMLHYRALEVRIGSPIRMPQSVRPALTPGPSGENLAACLYSMRESTPHLYEAVEDSLRAAFPGFGKLGFPSVAAGMVSITWQDAHFGEPFYPHELSEGTLRFLWLVTLLQSPGLPAVTLIDELEVSLHPELLSLLAELFREASTRTQLIVATQSDSLIRFLKPEEVVVMDIGENGLATATRADTFDLDAWLKDYTLDEVWRMGQMGGKAW